MAPWLLLVFSLPAKRASERVEIWRKLKKYGAVGLKSAGYLLPNTPEHLERFEWLAAAIRKYRGQASVVQVQSIEDLSSDQVRQMFVEARSRDYEGLIRELKSVSAGRKQAPASLSRLRRRFQEIAALDFFESPLRSRAEAMLARADTEAKLVPSESKGNRLKKDYTHRTWVTRPRPGIDRVSSAWLIWRFVDTNARFVFAEDPRGLAEAIPFDMFHAGGFGHRGDDCTFETLRKEFGIRDPKVAKIAEIIHDADLGDEKFGRVEGLGLDRVLIGWAQQGVPDEEILRRGMELIEGLYQSVS